jgi:hypothetical protein
MASRAIALAGLIALLVGCAQTASYAPNLVTSTYRLDNFSRTDLQVVVRDLRAERDNSDALVSAIQSQILNSLTGNATVHNRYTLIVDVIEHRSFFTLGNWNALTRLKWRVQRGNGSIIQDGTSIGEGHRSAGRLLSFQPALLKLGPVSTAIGQSHENFISMKHFHKSNDQLAVEVEVADEYPGDKQSHILNVQWTGQPQKQNIPEYIERMHTVNSGMHTVNSGYATRWNKKILYIFPSVSDPSGSECWIYAPNQPPERRTNSDDA